MIKRLQEWWMYWRYRNITRRWQLLKPKLRMRRQMPVGSAAFRARGSAMYMPRSRGGGRGLAFIAVVAAVLACVNYLLRLGPSIFNWIDLVILVALSYVYLQYGGV